MANRKVLINRHTSGNTAPVASTMYKGEIAVQHKTGEEVIWTKNNDDVMVPFISCAQTIAIIDSKIQTSDTDVMVKEGELHLEVSAGTGDEANKFTLNTVDVQSEEEFEAYSAATKVRIDTNASAITDMVAIVSALTDVVLTGISGDSIIVAEIKNPTTGANYVALTHKEAKEVALGFNKVATDKYGHVIDYSAVTTTDIQALGFKTSAETGEELAELSASVVANETHISELSAGTQADIEALSGNVVSYVNNLSAGTIQLSADTEAAISKAINDLDSTISASTTGKYITAIEIKDGKLEKVEEASIPVLSTASTGTGNVVTSIEVNDHEITYNLGAQVATDEDLQALSGSVIALSAGTIHDIETLSGDVIDYVKVVSGNIETVINELSAGTEAGLEALSAGTIADNNKLSADVITYINTISGYASSEIHELSGAVQANETDIDNLSAATLDLSAVTLTGVSLNNTPLTLSNHIVSVPVTTSGSGIANATDSGSVADAKAVKEYVENILSSAVEYQGATDSEPSNPSKGDLWIASSAFTVDGKNAEVGDFIIYNGSSWDVIEKNLDGAITGTLTQDTVTLGDSTNSVKSLANGASGQVLTIANGTPTWVDDPELSVVSAGTGNVVSDITVNDHEITFTKGVTAADSADLQTLSGMVETISGYTKENFTALSAGTIQLSADTKAAIAELSAGTIQLSADTKNAIAALSAGTIQLSADTHNKIVEVYGSATSYADALVAALDSVGSASTTGHYLTSVTITDGKITEVGEEQLPAATPITTVDGGTGNTASAVLYAIVTGGTEGHELTYSATNKIFSAVTSDSAISVVSAITSESAVTAVSAQTSVNAVSAQTSVSAVSSVSAITAESALTAAALTGNITSGQVSDIVAGIENTKVNSAYTAESADTAASADKVANALSVSGYATSESSALDSAFNYDGSAAQSLTFGKTTAAGKSMSFNEGVVDVEIIDCGSY